MGHNNSKLSSKSRYDQVEKSSLLVKENEAVVKLSRTEINSLKHLYHRLAALSPEDEYIDKKTFLHYFPLEGILAERLFSIFDKDGNNVINYEEFLGGLTLCLAGSIDDKFQLVFDLYNIDDGDGISGDELATVLKSTLLAAKAIVGPSQNNATGIDSHMRSRDIDEHVKNVVRDAFEQCDLSQTGMLSPEEFRNWAERHSYILDIIFGHYSFADKQKLSENITAAAFNAVKINSIKCHSQTWMETNVAENCETDYCCGYSEASFVWSPVFPVTLKKPKARSEHTACVFDGALYVLGGRGSYAAFKDFWKYDLALNHWSECYNKSERFLHIFGHTAVVHLGCMYVYGGEFDTSESFVWKYDFGLDEWFKIAVTPLTENIIPRNRRYHSAVIFRNRMYIFGGLVEIHGSTDEFWSFDLREEKWDLVYKSGIAVPGKRYQHSAVVYNKAMWIAGGLDLFSPRNDTWKWDFEKKIWLKIKCKGGPFPIRGHHAIRCGKSMFVVGGTSNGQYHQNFWKLDFISLTWSSIIGNVHPPARSFAAVVTLSAYSFPLLPVETSTTISCTQKLPTSKILKDSRPHSSPASYPDKEAQLSNERTSSSTNLDFLLEDASLREEIIAIRCTSSAGVCENIGTLTNSCALGDGDLSAEFVEDTYYADERQHIYTDKMNDTAKHTEKRIINTSEPSHNSKLSSAKGLCIFVIGGKNDHNRELTSKGMDIWRCDVNKYGNRPKTTPKFKVTSSKPDITSKRNISVSPLEIRSMNSQEQLRDFVDHMIPIRESSSLANTASSRGGKSFPSNVEKSPKEYSRTHYGDVVVTDLLGINFVEDLN
ncbi:uncharacterized protein LOC124456036 isoform X2 [Xenia sp. Carnegie-2017]|uniref:uncharacterized protein LOC124456036 isoform X2 n=1 Tax=Xenia sp. Carnegie-2017 TaxID=2897299 RepID=UPI001F038FF6|nr:uncharacterized protein LOC124456036 isoform X2 [Xenia sp. Carnegie-2017]